MWDVMACRERTTVVTAVDHPRRLPVQVSPVSRTINTYGVERNNLTVRPHARRWGRTVHAFAKELDDLAHLDHQAASAFALLFPLHVAEALPQMRSHHQQWPDGSISTVIDMGRDHDALPEAP